MLETFTKLQTTVKNYTQTVGSSTHDTFFKAEINRCVRELFVLIKKYVTDRTQTFSTVASQQRYHKPWDCIEIRSLQIAVGTMVYPVKPVQGIDEWNNLNMLPLTSSIPQFFLETRDEFSIFPIPADVYTGTLIYPYRLKDMTAEDYTTGTISTTEGDETVTGSGTTFTAAMVGRRLITTDGMPYRISSYTSATSIELESVYEGTALSGASYTIGESPEIPHEMHNFIPHYVAAKYFGGVQQNMEMARYHANMFWTGDASMNSSFRKDAKGGVLGYMKEYDTRGTGGFIPKSGSTEQPISLPDRLWGTTLTF